MAFIKGRKLCRAFFLKAAKPLLDEAFPKLTYSAGLLGYGSDVLGYDDAVSADSDNPRWQSRIRALYSPAAPVSDTEMKETRRKMLQ